MYIEVFFEILYKKINLNMCEAKMGLKGRFPNILHLNRSIHLHNVNLNLQYLLSFSLNMAGNKF